jgi:hypothetical protein
MLVEGIAREIESVERTLEPLGVAREPAA